MISDIVHLQLSPLNYAFLGLVTDFKISHDYFTDWFVFIVLSGEIRYSIENSGEHSLCAGELLICPPYLNIRKAIAQPAEVVYLAYSCQGDSRVPLGKLALTVNQRIYDDIRLLNCCAPGDAYASLLQMDIWHQICAMYSGPIIPVENQESENTISGLLAYMDSAIKEKLSLEMLCERSGFSKSALIQHFKLRTGVTPMQYITQKRIALACKMLASIQYTIKEIAIECGFSNEYYFSNAFRKHKGCSPSEYRRRYI